MLTFIAVLVSGMVLYTFAVAEFAGDVKRFERWLKRLFLPRRPRRSVPPGEAGTSARRTPPGVETPAAAGGAPGPEGTWSSPPAPGDVPEHDLLTDTEIGALHPRFGEPDTTEPRRPVNGRRMPTGPLLASPAHPPWKTAPQPAVEVLPARQPVPESVREHHDGPPREVLLRVRTALLGKDVTS